MTFWIDHPAVTNPVSMWRWLLWHAGMRIERFGDKLVERAIYPNGYDRDIPF